MQTKEASNINIHLWWSIGVLAALLIVLLTVEFGANEDLRELIGFAVSFTSLVLAIVAIGQAIYSSFLISQSIGEVRSAALKIEGPVKEIIDATNNLTAYSHDIKDKAGEIRSLAERFKEDIHSSANNISITTLKDVKTGESVSVRFLDAVALYIAIRSFLTRKPFTQMESHLRGGIHLGVLGYLTALESFGYIEVEANRSGELYVSDLKSLSWLAGRLDDIRDGKFDDESDLSGHVFKMIDSYFG